MPRGRMFEYTPTEIERRLEELSPDALKFIESIPTFVCSEIRENNSGTFMLVRYGTLSNLIVTSREVTAKFNVILDFGRVEFDSVQQARVVFEADKFQLYRTHWAVREGSAKSVLERLQRVAENQADAISETIENIEAQVVVNNLPPREKKFLGSADDVEQFLKLLFDNEVEKNTEVFFRGHENENFELTPSLLRKKSDGSWLYMPNEDRLCKELLIAHYDEFQDDQYCFDRLVRMQHYGLPTRLLDISINPLVALFFACSGASKDAGNAGEVIRFVVKSDSIKYYDSDTVSCISNLSNLSYAQKSEIDLDLSGLDFNDQDAVKKLIHHIRSEKAYFEDRIVPKDLNSIVCVKAKRTNTRIKSQLGAFLLFGHGANLPESGSDGIEISRIKITNKSKILKQLDSININATSIYPSIDRTTDQLRAIFIEEMIE